MPLYVLVGSLNNRLVFTVPFNYKQILNYDEFESWEFVVGFNNSFSK